jgi:hypothetical protein
MTKKENGKKSRPDSKPEVITRRAAMKRIAATIAGAGIVVVAGIIGSEKNATAAYFDQGYSAYASWHPYSSRS